MFKNIGTGELIIIAVILTVLFGGKKLPELAKGIGDASREFRKALNGVEESSKSTKKSAEKGVK